MRRRELLAGVGSAGVIAGAGAVAASGVPSVDELLGRESDQPEPEEPLEVETVDAPGSEAGTATVPASDRATFVDIFGTWCPPCVEQMPALAEANDRIGDEVLFISVTSESVGENGSITRAELADWWDEHGGDWTIGLDPTAAVTERYLESGYPSAAAIDATGRLRWSESGVKTADELVAGIERALEADP
ncbi:TlpA family protein disulfide reductase [Natronococcus sp. JC468]|uniref:TlpA family protein disulfide reductase n=1 Tax=Natronococcus sp. JC468 TaxID=1961921 RepID=UPI00143C3DA3|nr:TlpA disulfide reductase family protein [Natronococcus sp. JC468]NKE35609.1 TlpA family protein disulfide reductase [Natronococcus sp. JC468]